MSMPDFEKSSTLLQEREDVPKISTLLQELADTAARRLVKLLQRQGFQTPYYMRNIIVGSESRKANSVILQALPEGLPPCNTS